DDDGLSVGREQVRLADIDEDHLRAADSGADAGAPGLGGGGWGPARRPARPAAQADRRPHRARSHTEPGRPVVGARRVTGDTGLVTSLDSSLYTYEAPVSA